ncbi:glutamine--fructose-6-phosphate transaminase (isomerizing) [Methanocella conradii]|uniref:glutamine--fructose-6-phosphate transaminase (isomerizing) n=1 Tax=Methanocella conradii TaxID=1175444 RepID=UPI00157C7995|nr:glutamine--fructose-6-phosphate transaminase (isomerizing) [Methanocella conradii]
MCGIVGYIGNGNTINILLDSLECLEYRGYDSAGIALVSNDSLRVIKSHGRILNLKDKVPITLNATAGIGHTRWATHGKPSDYNAHPHKDCTGNFAVVHNGIIENYQSLKDGLIAQGHKFSSETDTEVIAHLLEKNYAGSVVQALLETVKELEGSYAIAIVSNHAPGKVFAAKKDSPIVIGLGDGQYFLASDVTAFLKYTKKAIFIEDGDIVIMSGEGIEVIDFNGRPVRREARIIDWELEEAEKSGYENYMLKEIHEQPKSLRDAIAGRLNELTGEVIMPELTLTKADIDDIKRIVIVACGTSYHAGMIGKYAIESMTDIPVSVEIGSEFRYSANRLSHETLVIALSQSGETADTIAAVKGSIKKGARVLAITNVVGSTVSREANYSIYMRCGPEIGVAATKTFTSQIVIMYLVALYLGTMKGMLGAEQNIRMVAELKALPNKVQRLLENERYIMGLASLFRNAGQFFFVGRNLNYPIALEGALKLKEISYIISEGYAAGELKHGPLALITTNIPVIAIATQCATYHKMVSNIKEIKARDASVIAIASESDGLIDQLVDFVVRIPDSNEYIAPILSTIVLQLFAYYIAVFRGCPVDKPRNLAKSVTVE